MLYILNSATLPLKEGGKYLIKARELSVKEASEMLKKEPFMSAVGHEATAKALSNIFGVEVPLNRIQITLQPGDKLISIILKKRLPEGTVLKTVEELEQIGYSIWLFEVYEDNIQEVERFLTENPGIV
jgi:c-di-GMP-related signal transduction protein